MLVAGKAIIPPSRPIPGARVSIDRPLPAYQLTDFEGRVLAGDELRRGRILLVYLETGCSPCVKEAEIISRLRQDAPPDLRIYGVAVEGRAQLTDFAKTHNLSFPILSDTAGTLARSLDTKYFPSKYLIEDGIITNAWYGKTRDEDELRHQLNIR